MPSNRNIVNVSEEEMGLMDAVAIRVIIWHGIVFHAKKVGGYGNQPCFCISCTVS